MMVGSAEFSPCLTYRYLLSRDWDPSKPRDCFILLNPSTADASLDDPTIRRCIGYVRGWNGGGLDILNIFALRSTDPKVLKAHADPVGPDNNKVIKEKIQSQAYRFVVCGWGVHGELFDRGKKVRQLLWDAGVHIPCCLTVTGGGHPGHPLYLRKDLSPIEF